MNDIILFTQKCDGIWWRKEKLEIKVTKLLFSLIPSPGLESNKNKCYYYALEIRNKWDNLKNEN